MQKLKCEVLLAGSFYIIIYQLIALANWQVICNLYYSYKKH